MIFKNKTMKGISGYLFVFLLIIFTSYGKDDLNKIMSNETFVADSENLDAAGLPIREFSVQVESIDFRDY
tara:strand:- start:65 stop:274 length:210 start_codon:yes stop_codon:yes gene_type:complete